THTHKYTHTHTHTQTHRHTHTHTHADKRQKLMVALSLDCRQVERREHSEGCPPARCYRRFDRVEVRVPPASRCAAHITPVCQQSLSISQLTDLTSLLGHPHPLRTNTHTRTHTHTHTHI